MLPLDVLACIFFKGNLAQYTSTPYVYVSKTYETYDRTFEHEHAHVIVLMK